MANQVFRFIPNINPDFMISSEMMIDFSHHLGTMASTQDHLKTERKPTKEVASEVYFAFSHVFILPKSSVNYSLSKVKLQTIQVVGRIQPTTYLVWSRAKNAF